MLHETQRFHQSRMVPLVLLLLELGVEPAMLIRLLPALG